MLETGAAFLRELGAALAEPSSSGKSGLAALLEKDEATGRSYLKLPMPEPEALRRIVEAAQPLLDMLQGGQSTSR